MKRGYKGHKVLSEKEMENNRQIDADPIGYYFSHPLPKYAKRQAERAKKSAKRQSK